MGVFDGIVAPGGNWSPDEVHRYWAAIERLVALPPDERSDALWDHISQIDDDPSSPLWFRLLTFQLVWNQVLQRNPPELRSLLLSFHELQMDAMREGLEASVAACARTCRYLAEIDDDDLNWTGFRLPGE